MSSYVLRLLSGDSLNNKGDSYQNKLSPLIVSHCENSDIRLANESEYEDIDFFTILYDDKIDNWYLIRLSREADILINGQQLDAIHYLHNNDIISAGIVDFKFTISKADYPENGKVVFVPSHIKQYIRRFILPVFLFLAILAGWQVLSTISRNNEWKALDKYVTSIYRLEIPEILIQERQGDDFVTIASIPDNSTVGTAFVTKDGTVITARHCIEPWVAFSSESIVATQDTMLKRYVSTSITRELLEGDTNLRVVSRVQLISPNEQEPDSTYTFLSSDFSVNRERDIIINLGTRLEPQYWRSLHPSYHRKDCALGDIAYLHNSGLKGSISIADLKTLSSIRKREDVVVLGYAVSSSGSTEADIKKGYIMRVPEISQQDNFFDDCIMLNDDASAGDSGGPVFIRRNGGLFVISVVSRRDDVRSEKTDWTVPISELYRNEHHVE